jgi:ATP-dependent Lhr-like helicase
VSSAPFSPPVAAWFSTTFAEPTPAQAQGWPAIAAGDHTLILAPTGSGKTLAAFLWGLDRLTTTPPPEEKTRRTRLLYLSPLRALAVDVEKNLRAPLAGIGLAAQRLGEPFHPPTVGMRTGDTSAQERRALQRTPPDLLITTPESLYLLLTSQARETLRGVETVIIDEIHALAPTKRGAHLALSLERLDALTDRPVQRIGLSATQRPLDEIARFLGGRDPSSGAPRPVTIVDAGVRKPMEVEVVVPVEDMGALGEIIEEPVSGPAAAGPVRRSIWPSIHPRLLELIESHRSTIVFVNARRLAERLATRLNELAWEGGTPPDVELVKAHHGSLSREQRLRIEDDLKSGRLRGLVATSSLELGIDMGAVDLVVQVESPGAVSRGLQRIGRAGHQVGEPSRGRVFPKHRADLVEAAVVVDRMRKGLIESTRYLRNPLDVLAQHVVAMVAMEDWTVADLARVVRASAPFAELSDDVLVNVLDLLAGRYPSEEFGELRPRLVWERTTDVLRARAGSQRLAVTNGGTIPDRGLYGVFLPDGTRVGELDEEMVYESRPGETFLLGASTWRIEDITPDRVVVTPAPGEPGKMPFWHGDGPGRPVELGRAVGEFVRGLRALPTERATAALRDDYGLDELAASNLVQYLDDEAEATGGVVPDDRTVVVERFRDEIGDWRICVLTPFGAPVHAPWAMALRARLAERYDLDVEMLWSDDGIVLRLPDTAESADEFPVDLLAIEPEQIDELVVAHLPGTALFTSRFREAAARALLLPRRRPDRRTPLWQQRQRAADLLAVAARYPDFPILLETTRECCNDVFDLPALRGLLADLRSRAVRVVTVDTPRASPFAQSLLFGWIAVYMYDYDAPLAERRAAALALDRDLLRELLGAEELRELIDPAVLAELELELQCLADGRRARDVDEVHDLVRRLGPLSLADLDVRSEGPMSGWVEELVASRRAIRVQVAGEERVAAAEDAARLRDALGVALPVGLPAAFTDPVADPLGDLVARYARTHGPFLTGEVARRYGVPVERVAPVLERLELDGRVVRGEFRPEGVEREWCDDGVLRQLRRRSLASLRREVEPVDGTALARFLPAWQGVGVPRRGLDGVVEAIGALQGAAIPASVLEGDVLAARVAGYRPADLDALCAAGEVVWVGAGPLGTTDGRVRLLFRDQAALLLDPPETPSALAPAPAPAPAPTPTGNLVTEPRLPGSDDEISLVKGLADALRRQLAQRGASFWPDLVRAAHEAGLPYDDESVLGALWDLVWAGEVTNDTLAPLRAMVGAGTGARRPGRSRPQPRSRRPNLGAVARVGPPAAAGRWSLVAPLLEPAPLPTEASYARALQLLERHGVLTREAVLAEGLPGGYAAVYPVLKALEERGQVRRGYFVAGLGAAQFALPGAVDRLRAVREPASGAGGGTGGGAGAVVLAATDPAQPYGAALPWPDAPGRPARAAGAYVVLVDGSPAAYLERGGRSLVVFPGVRGESVVQDGRWAQALASLVHDGRVRKVEIARIDGAPVGESPHAEALRGAGFSDGYRGLVLRG